MDLRKKKTEDAIRRAFYDLRKKKTTEYIRVREICERAQINKSTFYRHFSDVFELEEKLEDSIVKEIVDDICTGPSIIQNAEEFFFYLDEAFNGKKNCERKEILFSADPCRLLTKTEDMLRQRMMEEENYSFEDYILIAYALGGAFSVFRVGSLFIKKPDVPAIYGLLAQYADRIFLK
ncbi:MAG: TetR/AcrR family transcriptional regulator [Clostridia bacterium]|nr:TetR/AcrR family transcriptional regulator [Clostridia bacterium]